MGQHAAVAAGSSRQPLADPALRCPDLTPSSLVASGQVVGDEGSGGGQCGGDDATARRPAAAGAAARRAWKPCPRRSLAGGDGGTARRPAAACAMA